MIKIEIPKPDVTIVQRNQIRQENEPEIPSIHGFIDFHLIPRDKGGIFMFYNKQDELLFVGKARKLRQRVKKHFEDQVSPIKLHRDEVYKIEIALVEEPMEREIYETYIINKLQAKYNIDKVFYK
ncbi:nucleotide excision repair endonuclease [Mesobacillus foraminis]|uniref:GIY-YIG catalytic domain-containing protein n=1 Tax=Mesobacillus foraminis TaxID=279826 RepID=A0A4R2BIY2_9BACI|nr:nucleotide excision repair endonuclease [Mesobacillus foraminis]MBT2755207.1 nucleotide excision repair endonuclease [Mesobacillus foraminis]TCN27128.1 GIY-YIG catalytic domain-containing protein [Mesobacillus foraminis]